MINERDGDFIFLVNRRTNYRMIKLVLRFAFLSEQIDLLNRATWRFFEKAVMRLLVDVGQVCADYQDHVLRNLSTRRLQLDELWSWIFCKNKNVTPKTYRGRTASTPRHPTTS